MLINFVYLNTVLFRVARFLPFEGNYLYYGNNEQENAEFSITIVNNNRLFL
jgi:hypothetical protein